MRPSLHFYGMIILVKKKSLCLGMAGLPFQKCNCSTSCRLGKTILNAWTKENPAGTTIVFFAFQVESSPGCWLLNGLDKLKPTETIDRSMTSRSSSRASSTETFLLISSTNVTILTSHQINYTWIWTEFDFLVSFCYRAASQYF